MLNMAKAKRKHLWTAAASAQCVALPQANNFSIYAKLLCCCTSKQASRARRGKPAKKESFLIPFFKNVYCNLCAQFVALLLLLQAMQITFSFLSFFCASVITVSFRFVL